MKNRIIILLVLAFLISACDRNKDAKTNLMGSSDELVKFAKGVYGENVTIINNDDINNNSKPDVFACIVNKKSEENKYWIQKGSIIEKGDSGLNELLKIDIKLSNSKGEMIDQVDAKSGYIIHFLSAPKDKLFSLSIADSSGKPISDELFILWNKDSKLYELSDNPDKIQ